MSDDQNKTGKTGQGQEGVDLPFSQTADDELDEGQRPRRAEPSANESIKAPPAAPPADRIVYDMSSISRLAFAMRYPPEELDASPTKSRKTSDVNSDPVSDANEDD